uniref:Uncharacterized protein n=1 Tax=Oryza sativa subsp. japonica TaxID=39947 RepID=Q6ZCD0_ORYSJ|nr:hypothetical protein [Oryza sativa Japonica Group]
MARGPWPGPRHAILAWPKHGTAQLGVVPVPHPRHGWIKWFKARAAGVARWHSHGLDALIDDMMEALACRDGMYNLPAERNSCLSEADDRLDRQ